MAMQTPAGDPGWEWRELSAKLDRVLNTLSDLSGNVGKLEIRVSHLEKAPEDNRARWQLYLLGGGCLSMLINAVIATLLPLLVVYMTHH